MLFLPYLVRYAQIFFIITINITFIWKYYFSDNFDF